MDLVKGILGAVRPPVRVGVLGILALASVLLVSGCESQRDEPPGLVSTPAAATVAPTPAPTATIPATPAAATVAPTPAPAATPSAAAVATAIPTPTPAPAPAPAPAPTGITSNAAAVTAAPTPTPTPMPAGMNGVATEPVGRPHPSDAYFALDHVLDVAIDLASEDWDSLRTQTRAFADVFGGADCLAQPFDSPYSWFPAQVTVDGETRADAGVRKKGFLGSGNTEKPSLKLRFDKYVDGQMLGGVMERMTLNNSTQDESLINTCLAYQVFADAGLPVPRCNFATVSVNGESLGLYVHVEDLKTSMVDRSFANAEGNLYEGTMSDFRPEWRGTFEKKTNEDADDWSDIHAVVTALQDPSPSGLAALDAAIDRDRFLSFWATEVLVGHWDGYASNRNNFYFYGEPGAPLVFIPWGVDQVFGKTDNPIDGVDTPPSVMAHGAIAHRLYRDDAMRAAYADRLRELLDTVWNEAELLQRTDELAAIVQTHAPTETRAGAASDADRVRRFIRERRAEVLADLEPEPPAWPWPPAEAADFCRGGSGAFESGTFELRFETTWGSKESGDPINEGTVTYTHFQLDGTEQRVNLSGVTAGIASPEEAADWGIGEAAVIAISNVKPGFAADGFSVWVPIDRVSSGSGLVIGMDDGVGGAYWSLLIGADEPVRFVPLIEAESSSTRPARKRVRRFQAASTAPLNSKARPPPTQTPIPTLRRPPVWLSTR